MNVGVYALGTGKWRYGGFTDQCTFNYSSGIHINGALFWLHRSNGRLQESEIVAFDLEGEKFQYIALPRSEDFEYMVTSYHLNCLDPPLKSVPIGVWHCVFCVKKKVESGVHSLSGGVGSILDAKEVELADSEGRCVVVEPKTCANMKAMQWAVAGGHLLEEY